jgi:hypothetical protein
MVFRAVFPERVRGNAGTFAARRKAATGPTVSLTISISSFATTSGFFLLPERVNGDRYDFRLDVGLQRKRERERERALESWLN